jgi:NAD(P)H-hydrate epimerase
MRPELVDRLPPLPPREPAGHKGTFGTALVVGGHLATSATDAFTMVGGPALSALAALRAGCGLVELAVPEPLVPAAAAIAPEAVLVPLPAPGGTLDASAAAERLEAARARARAIAIGPGLGTGWPERQLTVAAIAREDLPVVLDADALNCLAALPDFARDLRAPAILTPHPGEFARLAAALDLSAAGEGPDGRLRAAATLAARLGAVVVLKGPGTVVTDGLRAWIGPGANPALATAGSGDVLTGILVGLLARLAGRSPLGLFELAAHAVERHARAGERWSADFSADTPRAALARELLPRIGCGAPVH